MMKITKKFIEIKNGDGDEPNKSWLLDCKINKKPYVTVLAKYIYADVSWDYISYPMGCEKIFTENEEEIKISLDAIYAEYANKKSNCTVSASTSTFSGLSIENAKNAASDIYDLIDRFAKNKFPELLQSAQ